jgi:hypothetical protein
MGVPIGTVTQAVTHLKQWVLRVVLSLQQASKREDLHVQVSDDARVRTELAGYRSESLRALPEIAIEAVVVVCGAAERV